MPKRCLIAHKRVRDAAGFERVRTLSSNAIAQYGGDVLARRPEADHLDCYAGGLGIVSEFDSLEVARTFDRSDASAEARATRGAVSDTDLVLECGMAP